MKRVEVMPLGVVIERREIDNPWQDHVWRPVAVFPGAPKIEEWKVLERGEGWVRYHAATLPLELYRNETESYRLNLSNKLPSVFIVLRDHSDDDESEYEVEPFLATASPYEAQDYLDAGDDIIEPVPMPEGVVAWVQAFIDAHHVDEPFRKRKRKRATAGDGFGKRLPVERRRRANGGSENG